MQGREVSKKNGTGKGRERAGDDVADEGEASEHRERRRDR